MTNPTHPTSMPQEPRPSAFLLAKIDITGTLPVVTGVDIYSEEHPTQNLRDMRWARIAVGYASPTTPHHQQYSEAKDELLRYLRPSRFGDGPNDVYPSFLAWTYPFLSGDLFVEVFPIHDETLAARAERATAHEQKRQQAIKPYEDRGALAQAIRYIEELKRQFDDLMIERVDRPAGEALARDFDEVLADLKRRADPEPLVYVPLDFDVHRVFVGKNGDEYTLVTEHVEVAANLVEEAAVAQPYPNPSVGDHDTE